MSRHGQEDHANAEPLDSRHRRSIADATLLVVGQQRKGKAVLGWDGLESVSSDR